MIAMVITRFVAILVKTGILENLLMHARSSVYRQRGRKEEQRKKKGGKGKKKKKQGKRGKRGRELPTRHAAQGLDAPIDVGLALEEAVVDVLDAAALLGELAERVGADGLGLVGEGLRRPQPLRAAVQPLRAGQQLLALLQVRVRPARGGVVVVPVAPAEQGRPVVR